MLRAMSRMPRSPCASTDDSRTAIHGVCVQHVGMEMEDCTGIDSVDINSDSSRTGKQRVSSIIYTFIPSDQAPLPQVRHLVLDRPGIKLPVRIVMVPVPHHMSPMLALPDESPREQQHNNADRPNSVEDVRDSDSVDPRHHSEDEDGAQRVAREGQADQGIADDLKRWN